MDIFIYMTSYLIDQKEFIAVWLVLKLAGEWKQSEFRIDRPLHQLFIIGNGLNVIIGVLSASIINWLIK